MGQRKSCAHVLCAWQAFQFFSLSFPSPLSSLLASPPSPSSELRLSSKVSEKEFSSKGQGLELQQTLEPLNQAQSAVPRLKKEASQDSISKETVV